MADIKKLWDATGISALVEVEISPDTKQHICITLSHFGLISSDGFFEEISQAIARFNAGKEIAGLSSPSAVRGNLSAALKATYQLNDKLNDLDHNSRQLINEVIEGGIITLQSSLLSQINKALGEASVLADKYQKRGRLREDHRLWFAADVAEAIRDYIDVEPSSTKDGLFESILCIILSEITGQETTTHHDLVRHALQVKITRGKGVTEYERIKDV